MPLHVEKYLKQFFCFVLLKKNGAVIKTYSLKTLTKSHPARIIFTNRLEMATVSLFPSPAKKGIYRTDFKKCIICQDDNVSGKLNQLHEKSYTTIIQTVELRTDNVSKRLEQDLHDKSQFLLKVPLWHASCRASWTSKTNVLSSRKRKLSPSPSTATHRVTRTLMPGFNFKEMCFLCAKSKLPGNRKHEKFICVELDYVQQYIYQCVKDSDDVIVYAESREIMIVPLIWWQLKQGIIMPVMTVTT